MTLRSPDMRLLVFGGALVLVEYLLRRFAPASRAYRAWKGFFVFLGSVWTAVLLSLIYFVSVSVVSLAFRLSGRDPLDRRLAPEPSFWRAHEPSPLGPENAARHQF